MELEGKDALALIVVMGEVHRFLFLGRSHHRSKNSNQPYALAIYS